MPFHVITSIIIPNNNYIIVIFFYSSCYVFFLNMVGIKYVYIVF